MKLFIIGCNNLSRRVSARLGMPAAYFSLLALMLMLTGCLKNEFQIKVALPESVSATYKVVYHAASPKGGRMMEAAIVIVGGKGELKGITRNPTVVALYSTINTLPSLLIYAERGEDINITGADSDPFSWDIDGNKVNKSLTEWRKKNIGLLTDAVNAGGGMDVSKARQALNKSVAAYVKENQKSVASLMLLIYYYDASSDAKGYQNLLDLLRKNGVTDDYPDMAVRQDMITSTDISAGGGKRLKDIIVKAYSTNIDTLRLASGKHPTLMYFWRRGDILYREDIDSLKRIAAWRGDSAKMGIADFCLDTDSMSWVNPVNTDSIKHTLRAWAPRGIADPDIMQMGVGGTPWWIVTDAKGKILYSGEDKLKAIEQFRKQK